MQLFNILHILTNPNSIKLFNFFIANNSIKSFTFIYLVLNKL